MKRARREALEDSEEQRLTSLIFGSGSEQTPANLEAFDDEDNEEIFHENEAGDSGFAFEIDRVGAEEENNEGVTSNWEHMQIVEESEAGRDSDGGDSDSDGDEDAEEESAPAWVDKDDQKLSVDLMNSSSRLKQLRKSRDEAAALALGGDEFERRLRQRYEETTQRTARTDWARLDTVSKSRADEGEGDDQEDEDVRDAATAAAMLGSTSASLLASSQQRLPPNIINIVRCSDANQSDPNEAVVQAVHFHPGSDIEKPLLLTAGLDKTLRFFQVGAEKSEKIHGIHCKRLRCLTRLAGV